MAIVKIPEDLPALSASGRIGNADGLGAFMLGWSWLGQYNKHSGYYKKNGRWRRSTIVRTKHYWPNNPQTEAQQTNRNIFAEGVSEWHLLTENEKEEWKKQKYPPRRTGFTAFMSDYLKKNL